MSWILVLGRYSLMTGTGSLMMGSLFTGAATAEEVLNQPPDGFVALFNGRDLEGWQGQVGNPLKRAAMPAEELAKFQRDADRNMRQHWTVSDGELVFDGRGNNLCTAHEYENFELYVDWRIEPQGESGIYLRGSPQVQISDPGGSPDGSGSGGLFNNLEHASEPLVRADRPVGEWNTFYIMMIGNRVNVKLNDKLVVDDTVLENYWQRDRPIYNRGPIELQNHGSRLRFRNIFLRELPSHPSPPWEVLFDGSDLNHWDFQRRGWRIEDDGVLSVSRRRRNTERDNSIWTKERYGDFILDLEFLAAPDCNSGIFIRTDDRENWLHTGIEIQILDSYAKEEVDKHDCGAVYDVMAPSRNAALPPGEWNHITIVAQDNLLSVTLNSQRIIDIDLNEWTVPHQNPDGTQNKFDTAYREMRREGFIGFQDHGTPISFRNVRLKRLVHR